MRKYAYLAVLLLLATTTAAVSVALWLQIPGPVDATETARIGAQAAAPLAMDFMDIHPELKGIVVVVIDNGGGTGSVALSRESSLSSQQLFQQAMREAVHKLKHPESVVTVMDHMPRPGESGNPHGEQHAL